MSCRIRPATLAVAAALSSLCNAHAADASPVLGEVAISASRLAPLPEPGQLSVLRGGRAPTSDTASLLLDTPGMALQTGGGLSSLPILHGLADDRLRITVDGMDFIASCPNHMNPPLSYIDPASLASIRVFAGITPVSVGGDSIGGAIVAETLPPQFAPAGAGLLVRGEIGAHGQTNNQALGTHLSATLATETISLSYAGAAAQAGNYRAGSSFRTTTASGRPGHAIPTDEVGSTAYESWTHQLNLAFRSGSHLVEARAGYQDIPQQLYPNQRMDMLGNEQVRLNLRYLGQFDWGLFETRIFHEAVDHYMNFGPDKQLVYGTALNGMPMYTRSFLTGASVRADIELGTTDTLRTGALFQHYTLDDWWPASGTGMMSPNSFENIREGRRDRLGMFAEWESRLSSRWTTLLGARYERVATDTGTVHGYNLATAPLSGSGGVMGQTTDAVALNSRDRARTDHNVDLTALARYRPDAATSVEFGLARKVRSPNLYERYTWSTWSMAAVMNNVAGDGNGYVGNPDLKPETAYTASAAYDWQSADRQWQFRASPYYTHVDDYIDVVRCSTAATGACPGVNTVSNQFVRLKYANQSARLYGLDLSARMPLARSPLGDFDLKAMLSYTHGENRETGDALYNIMPLNTRLTLSHQLGNWQNALEWVGVQGKHDVADVRNEIRTAGYSLTHLRGSYTHGALRIDLGVENLFDKHYTLPTGGAYTGQGATMGINSIPWGVGVPGMGRTFYAGFNLKF